MNYKRPKTEWSIQYLVLTRTNYVTTNTSMQVFVNCTGHTTDLLLQAVISGGYVGGKSLGKPSPGRQRTGSMSTSNGYLKETCLSVGRSWQWEIGGHCHSCLAVLSESLMKSGSYNSNYH